MTPTSFAAQVFYFINLIYFHICKKGEEREPEYLFQSFPTSSQVKREPGPYFIASEKKSLNPINAGLFGDSKKLGTPKSLHEGMKVALDKRNKKSC